MGHDESSDASSVRDIEALVWEEARRDLAEEAEGKKHKAGPMQQAYPDEYRTTRELLSSMVAKWPLLMVSMKRAESLSTLMHSEHTGLTEIQDALTEEPINALTLARLLSIERGLQETPSEKELRSRNAKHAVSFRLDQVLKPRWEDHCKKSIKDNVPISTVNDLLDLPDCDPRMKEIGKDTLKAWARAEGITFKGGRPKKK